MQFKIGDMVIWKGSGEDNGARGRVTHVLGKKFEVTWDKDGEAYTYEDWPGGSVKKVA